LKLGCKRITGYIFTSVIFFNENENGVKRENKKNPLKKTKTKKMTKVKLN